MQTKAPPKYRKRSNAWWRRALELLPVGLGNALIIIGEALIQFAYVVRHPYYRWKQPKQGPSLDLGAMAADLRPTPPGYSKSRDCLVCLGSAEGVAFLHHAPDNQYALCSKCVQLLATNARGDQVWQFVRNPPAPTPRIRALYMKPPDTVMCKADLSQIDAMAEKEAKSMTSRQVQSFVRSICNKCCGAGMPEGCPECGKHGAGIY